MTVENQGGQIKIITNKIETGVKLNKYGREGEMKGRKEKKNHR